LEQLILLKYYRIGIFPLKQLLSRCADWLLVSLSELEGCSAHRAECTIPFPCGSRWSWSGPIEHRSFICHRYRQHSV